MKRKSKSKSQVEYWITWIKMDENKVKTLLKGLLWRTLEILAWRNSYMSKELKLGMMKKA